jgi:hypothetical protein
MAEVEQLARDRDDREEMRIVHEQLAELAPNPVDSSSVVGNSRRDEARYDRIGRGYGAARRADLDDGTWAHRNAELLEREETDLGIRLAVARF